MERLILDQRRDVMSSLTTRRRQRVIVLLHGMMGNVTNWQATIRHFRDRYNLIPIEFPLYEPEAPYYNVQSLTEIVRQRLAQRRVRRAVFFGNSMGGQVALNLAYEHPKRVAALVLTGSAGLLERNLANGRTPLKPSREWIRERVLEIFYDPAHATDEIVDEVLTILSSTKNKLRLVKLARALRQYNMHEILPRISCPTLLIWGRQDTITPVKAGEMFAQRMPDARIHILDRCGHAPNIEQPEAFNLLAEQFLKEIGYR